MNIIEKFILNKISNKVSNWFELERSLTSIENVYKPVDYSPVKSWPNPIRIPSGEEVPFSIRNMPIVGLNLRSCVHQGTHAIKSIDKNPIHTKNIIEDTELKEFESMTKQLGIEGVGYTKLSPHLIFKDRAVLFDTAIVLIMQMDEDAISKAPSKETFKMVMSTYDALGIATNKLTDWLREKGYKAQASHPLGGLVLYPPLAVEAGLGWMGRHGLLITPQFGPRQRIAAIFVDIDNLPISTTNDHKWIGDFCTNCARCINSCPSKAILKQPITHESGRKTHIVREKCLPVFVKQEGCTVCIKECTFTKLNYEAIKESYLKM